MEPSGNPEAFGYSGYTRGIPAQYSGQTRGHYNTSSGQGYGASRQVHNVIPEDHRSDIPPAKFIGPEPIIHSQAEFDDYIARTKGGPRSYTESSHATGASFSDDITRESTGVKNASACLLTLKPQRFEMPNHPSYHGELNSKEAEGRLSMGCASLGSNCYLTRYSKGTESYVVSALIHHKGSPTPVHIKLNIDKDNNIYSLEGTEKIFRTLDELLNYFENNPLSSEIRGLGTPCLPPDKSQHGTLPRPRGATGSIDSSNSDPIDKVLQMQEKFLHELEKQREDHKKELAEERKVYREEIEKERDMNRELLRAKEKEEEPKPQNAPKEKKDCTIL